MRHYLAMPKELVKKDREKKATLTANHAVFRRYGDLADQQGFGGDEVAS
jgi:hypothetical protein